MEGWHIKDGFYYITSMLCGLPNPLTDVSPETDGGKIVDIVIAIWQGGYSLIQNRPSTDAESSNRVHASE